MRKKNNIIITKKLNDEIREYTVKMTSNMSRTIEDKLIQTASNAINAFYEHYTPKYYSRHYYNFEKYSFKGYYRNPHNSVVRGGVELTPYRLQPIYDYDPEGVFQDVYNGIHGFAGDTVIEGIGGGRRKIKAPPVMSPSPLDIIYGERDRLVKNINRYKVNAQKKIENNFTTFRLK